MPAWYHAVFAGAALAAGVSLGSSSSACGGKPPPHVSVPLLQPEGEHSATPAAAKPAHPEWLALASLSALPLASPEPYAALGHGPGRSHAVVRVSEPARDGYLAPTPEREFPEGTVVAQFTKDLRTGSAGPVYAMRKHTQRSWEFAVLRADGVLLDFGPLPLCSRCHAEAPADFVFGVPRPANE